MPIALICDEGQGKAKSLEHNLSNLHGWDIHSSSLRGLVPPFVDNDKKQYDLHFIIYSRKLDPDSCKELVMLRQQQPFTFIIYYYRCLLDQQFMMLTELAINSCIIGLYRKNYLRDLLPHLWQKHWKRIPDSIYPAETSTLSPRAKKILIHIEDHAFCQFNLQTLADYLNISESHFRAEFRHDFGINFREFKQRLLNHYESTLLLNNDYKPNVVYKLLNYSNLANLSRSFKKRHGDSWRNIKNNNGFH